MLANNSVTHINPTVHAKAGKAMMVTVRGRVEAVRVDGNKYYTQLLSPSVDAYSSPVLIEIASRRRFALVDAEVSCCCILGGFSQNLSNGDYDQNQKNAHPMRVVHTLDLVESADEF